MSSPKLMEPSKEDFSRLGLRASAYVTPEMVRKAFRNMAKQVHPDRNDSPSATVEFQKLNQAYTKVMSYLSSLSGNSGRKKKWDIVLLNNMSSRPSVDQGSSNVVIKSAIIIDYIHTINIIENDKFQIIIKK